MRLLFLAALTALAALFAGPPAAQALPLPYNNGDLFLGVRASDGDGVADDFLINIGPASQFIGKTSPFTVPNLGSLGAALDAIYGQGWSSREDVFWSISGGNLPADPENTLYATRQAAGLGQQPLPWLGDSNSAQGVVITKFNALAGAYANGTATAGTPAGTRQHKVDPNSYASFQPGGTVQNSNGQSFAYFSPSIEASFANGPAGSVLDLIRVEPVYQQFGQDLGSFTLDASGVLTFTPAPVTATVQFKSATYSVDEDSGAGRAFVTLTRGGNLSVPFTVELSTTEGTAHAPLDYTAQSSVQVTFGAFQSLVTAEIPIVLRAGLQTDRDFTVSLANPTAGTTIGALGTATVTIVESESLGGKLNFAVNSYQKSESATTDVTVTISVTRTNGQTGAASVQVIPNGGTATAGTDYTLPSPLTLNWADGDTAPQTFDLTVKVDDLSEVTETAILSLSAPTGAVLGHVASTTVAIFDGTPVKPGTVDFTAATFAKAENATTDATIAITATRTGGKSVPVTVEVAPTGGTATLGTDYTLPGNPALLSWAAGEDGPKTVTVTIKPDLLAEGSETALFTLQNPTGGLVIGTQVTTTLTISDPADSLVPTLTLTNPKANAKVSGASVTFTGVATDDQSVGKIELSLNGAAPQTVIPGTLAKTYSYSITAVPEQGANTVTVKAYDGKGNVSTTLTRAFSFTNVRPLLAGSYSGLLVAGSDPLLHQGLVTVSVTPTGTFTGTAKLGGVSITLGGIVTTAGDLLFTTKKVTPFALTRKVGTVVTDLGHLALKLNTGAGQVVTGTLKDAAGTQTLATTTAGLGIYAAKKPAPAPFANVPVNLLNPATDKGKYTVIFQAHSGTNNGVAPANYPLGDGWAQLTISTAGVATGTGKLADGQIFSFSSAIRLGNKWPVYVPLYTNKGFITGDIIFDPAQAQTDAAGPLVWYKQQSTINKDKNYPAGWASGIGLDFAASKYLVPTKPTVNVPNPPNPDTALGAGLAAAPNATTTNIVIKTADGGLPDSSNDASISSLSKITVITNPSVPKTLKASLVPTTGALSGSFIHPGTNKALTFNGVAFQKTKTASGYFLYVPPATPPGALDQSGAVGLEAK